MELARQAERDPPARLGAAPESDHTTPPMAREGTSEGGESGQRDPAALVEQELRRLDDDLMTSFQKLSLDAHGLRQALIENKEWDSCREAFQRGFKELPLRPRGEIHDCDVEVDVDGDELCKAMAQWSVLEDNPDIIDCIIDAEMVDVESSPAGGGGGDSEDSGDDDDGDVSATTCALGAPVPRHGVSLQQKLHLLERAIGLASELEEVLKAVGDKSLVRPGWLSDRRALIQQKLGIEMEKRQTTLPQFFMRN